jgi:hypothetical protein
MSSSTEHHIQDSLPLVEQILSAWKSRIGDDYQGYKNHVYRMLHCCFALAPCSEEDRKKLMIAACFHDIGLWSDHTVDYLPPSVREAEHYLKEQGLERWSEEIRLLIDLHHQLRPIKGELNRRFPLLEAFRKADLADVSLGLVRGGVPAAYMKKLKQQFPDAGFHPMLLKTAGKWFSKNPLTPPPFLKW